MDKTTIEIEDKKEKKEKYDVLFTMNSDDTNKNYIVYTDNTRDEESNIKAYAAIYKDDGKLFQIKEDIEWNTLEELLNKFNKEGE